jgi:2-polyprenyl-6-methoxyphenol hydroxylase-like FAD-dependent oxidoreductase
VSHGVAGRRQAEVIGDGPAAWALAITLARAGWSATVRRRAMPSQHVPQVELMASSSTRQLARLGIAAQDLRTIARPCPGTWSTWGSDEPDTFDSVSSLYGESWSVNRAGLEALMRQRARALGVKEESGSTSPPLQPGSPHWQVLACGAVSKAAGATDAETHDDRLIAFAGFGPCAAPGRTGDARLLIEALPHGWAYGLLGPGGVAVAAFVTDAYCLTGQNVRAFAADALRGSARVAALFEAIGAPARLAAVPIPCRRRPLLAGPQTVRVGDAQASYDPVAGRGLWEALRMGEQVAQAMDAGGDAMPELEQSSRRSYDLYLRQRMEFYASAQHRFDTGFWSRRTAMLRNALYGRLPERKDVDA